MAHFFIISMLTGTKQEYCMPLPDERNAVSTLGRREKQLWELLDDFIAGLGFRLVDIEISGSGSGKKSTLKLFVTKQGGISIDELSDISREVSTYLDVKDPFPGAYQLEVSSPGLHRALRRKAHFEEEQGNVADLVFREEIDGERKISATIVNVYEENGAIMLELDNNGNPLNVPLAMIARAHKHFEM